MNAHIIINTITAATLILSMNSSADSDFASAIQNAKKIVPDTMMAEPLSNETIKPILQSAKKQANPSTVYHIESGGAAEAHDSDTEAVHPLALKREEYLALIRKNIELRKQYPVDQPIEIKLGNNDSIIALRREVEKMPMKSAQPTELITPALPLAEKEFAPSSTIPATDKSATKTTVEKRTEAIPPTKEGPVKKSFFDKTADLMDELLSLPVKKDAIPSN